MDSFAFEHIPVSINDSYGDPFIPRQIDDTIQKINSLRLHKAPIAIITKAPYNEEVCRKLSENVIPNPNICIFYSFTTMNEGGYTSDQRIKFIDYLNKTFGNVSILYRPIIPKKNDGICCLQKAFEISKEYGSYLTIGGLHNKRKQKFLDPNVSHLAMELSKLYDVKLFYKTSCCASFMQKTSCWTHETSGPQNIDVVKQLGYPFEIIDGNIVLEQATVGDLNFLRMITRSNVFSKKISNNLNTLSLLGHRKLECTSSWFVWARNIKECIGCDYCIINKIEYLRDSDVEIGCLPSDLSSYHYKADVGSVEGKTDIFLSDTKDNGYYSYEMIRTHQICSNIYYR